MAKGLLQAGAQLATGGATDPKERLEICSTCSFKSDSGRCWPGEILFFLFLVLE
ncbi:hypothetical protein EV13_0101 [Prochlorococcus sp. MIT 0702]|nr:hypothetical protein EV12_3108 [Prochlorococcus sp. MIT 0701]KGG30061.1 hypothetical protein EV14_2994 [Prochlorococcus sp. MIT 0703]KGG30664.1 hypothetical protein EV13_0101 [Prochlorococcus sp. MIT 0702]